MASSLTIDTTVNIGNNEQNLSTTTLICYQVGEDIAYPWLLYDNDAMCFMALYVKMSFWFCYIIKNFHVIKNKVSNY